MKLLTRYIFKQASAVFLLSLITLTTVVWLTQALKQLDLLTTKGQSLGIFLMLTVLLLPGFISIIAPIAFFIASIYTLHKMNSDSELIVINSAGASKWRVLSPLLCLAFLVSIFLTIFNHDLIPRSLSLARYYVTQISADLLANIVKEGRFTSKEANLTFHIRERTKDGELLGLLVHDERTPSEGLSYLAEKGRIVNSDDGTYLVMQDGSIQRQEGKHPAKTKIIDFERYVFDLSQFQRDVDTETVLYEPRERSTLYLLSPDPNDGVFIHKPGKFRAELHSRLASPLYPFMFAFIAFAAVGFAQTTRQNRMTGLVLAVSAGLIAQLLGFASLNVVKKSASAVPLMYAVPLATMIISFLIALNLLPTDRIFRKLNRLLEGCINWVKNKLRKGDDPLADFSGGNSL